MLPFLSLGFGSNGRWINNQRTSPPLKNVFGLGNRLAGLVEPINGQKVKGPREYWVWDNMDSFSISSEYK